MSVSGFRSFELKHDEVKDVISGVKRKQWTPTHELALRIVCDLIYEDLRQGYTDVTLQWKWVASRLHVTDDDIRKAMKLLSARKILVLKKMSVKGKSAAIWTMNDLYLTELERTPKRQHEVLHLWSVEFGSEEGADRFFEALVSIRATSKRATARALIDFGLQMLDEVDNDDV